MAEIKYLDHDGLVQYDELIKAEIDEKVAAHSGSTTSHVSSTDRTNWNAAKTHADSAHAPANAEKNQNAFSNVVVGSTTIAADTATDSLTIAAGTGISVSGDATNDKVTITNSGVRSISTGGANGTISVNTNGTSANVAVKGLGSAAYTASTAYDAAGTAQTKADAALASAKTYADQKVADLLENSTEAVDSIFELRDAMETNADVIEALQGIVEGKADADHDHAIADVTGLQSALDGKANSSHGTHVTWSTTAPVMDGTAAVGTATTVARSDHKHPTDTSRASKSEFDSHVANKSNPHGVTLAQLGVNASAAELNYVDGVTSSIQTQLNDKAASSHNQASSTINAMTGYTIASASAAIAATDSLNTAMGKLEKGLNSTMTVAQAAYSYLPEQRQIKTISSSEISALFA